MLTRARAAVHKLFTFEGLTFPSHCGIIYMESEDTNMLQKNIEKEERKNRRTWGGYYTRKKKVVKNIEKVLTKTTKYVIIYM